MDPRRSVLIVDRSPESREVLRTVLEHRGMTILEASAAPQGLELARRHQPDLIVFDVEVDTPNPAQAAGEFASQCRRGPTPLVILGTARRRSPSLPGEFVAKPYHYAPLIRKIEQLLEAE